MTKQISNEVKKIVYTLVVFLLSYPMVAGAHGDSGLEQGYNSMHWGSGAMMGGGGFWPFLMVSGYLIWLIIGILVIVWLWKKITNGKK